MRSERLKRHFQNSEQAVYKRDFGLNRQPARVGGAATDRLQNPKKSRSDRPPLTLRQWRRDRPAI